MEIPFIIITQPMLDEALSLIEEVKVKRTKASDIDTLTGIIGEFVFAQFYYNDWKLHMVGKNKGDVDFPDIEIKTSSFPFNKNLNLLVREDYALKRKPKYYVQIIIDVTERRANSIPVGTKAYICGYASSNEVDKGIKKDMGSKYGGSGGYLCHCIPIIDLHPISELK